MELLKTINQELKKCGYIKELHMFREINGEECERYHFRLILVDYPCWDTDEFFDITFVGVCNLQLGNIDNLSKIMLDIEQIGSYQLEKIRYSIRECENDMFSFQCQDILLN